MTIELLPSLFKRIEQAEKEAHEILSTHEASKSRIIFLEGLLREIRSMPVDVETYFQESIKCLEVGCIRAGMVLAWSGLFEILAERLYSDKEAEIRSVRPKWKFKDLAELKEQFPESQILDVGKEVGVVKKAHLKVLQGHLATRNQCAHPTVYLPSLNVGIGYVDELIAFTKLYISP